MTLWPEFASPADVSAIEAVPLADRGLPATTYDILGRAADLWPDRIAVSVLPEATSWRSPSTATFGQLRGWVNQAANLLHSLGVERRTAVCLLAPNCLELIVSVLAAQAAGIAAPVNPTLDPAQVRDLLTRSGARVLIAAGPEFAGTSWQTALDLARAGAVDRVIVLRPTGVSGAAPGLPAIDGVQLGFLTEAAGHRDDQFLGVPPVAEDLAAIFHTGGTTGVPKLAAHTHANEVVDAWMIAVDSLLDEDSVVFAALPLFHVNALVVTLLGPLLRGQHVVWAGPLGYRDVPLYAEFWRIVEHFRIAMLSAVPTVYQVLAGCPIDADISSLRFAIVGAAALPPAVRQQFEAGTGVRLVEGYGLTEATCASVRGFLNHPRPGSVGMRLPYQQTKVVRVDTETGDRRDAEVGEVGVLMIGGPTVFPGYVVGHDARGLVLDGMGKLIDGWLDTGDLGRIDQDGFVHLTGRAKDLIIRGGHNIEPGLIEEALLAHPAVVAAAAVGRPDQRAGEIPVAYVVLATGASATEAELTSWAAQHIAEKAATPKEIHVIDSLPQTAVGKLYKLPLRADAARRAVEDQLAAHQLATTVDADVLDGSVTVMVTPAVGVDQEMVRKVLDGFALSWRFSEELS